MRKNKMELEEYLIAEDSTKRDFETIEGYYMLSEYIWNLFRRPK
jgi:hypothetical protein